MCPNKNLQEWKDLEIARGTAMASYLWGKYEGVVPQSEYKSDATTNGLSPKLLNFLDKLNVTVEFKEELAGNSTYNALSLTDLLYKTILVRADYAEEGLLRESAYVAYKFLGKNNKIRTDLIRSVESLTNYTKVFNDYKEQNPKLSDSKIKELVVIDFLADSIKNNFEAPKDSYINRKAEYWELTYTSALEKAIKLLLIKIKQFLQSIVPSEVLTSKEVEDLLSDIANDVLNTNFQKYREDLTENEQLVNFEDTMGRDEVAKSIVTKFQALDMLLTGSLALRKEGTLYRSPDESLHDLDFTYQLPTLKKFNQTYVNFENSPLSKPLSLNDFEQSNLYKKIKQDFPTFKLTNAFGGFSKLGTTIQGEIGVHKIDIFLVPKEAELSTHEKGFQDWLPIFKAKLQMGRRKDIKDFVNYIPFNSTSNFAAEKGFRHFTFKPIKAFTQKQKESKREQLSTEDLQLQADNLKAVFFNHGIDVQVILDTTLDEIGHVENKDGKIIVRFNPRKAKTDSVFHEFGHIYVDLLGYNSNVIQAGVAQLRNTKLWEDIAKLYPELNEEQLAKEVLTTAIGIEADKLFTENKEKSNWRIWLDNFFETIGRLFGRNGNVAKQLARDLVQGNLTGKIQGEVSKEIQRQKDATTLKEMNWRSEELKTLVVDLKKIISQYHNLQKKPGAVQDMKQLVENMMKYPNELGEIEAFSDYARYAKRMETGLKEKLEHYKDITFEKYEAMSKEEQEKLKDFLVDSNEIFASLVKIENFTAEDDSNNEFIDDVIKELKALDFTSLRNKRAVILNEIYRTLFNKLSSDPKYGGKGQVYGVREFNLPKEDETLAQLYLDAMADSTNPIAANLVKLYDHTMFQARNELDKVNKEFDEWNKKLKAAGLSADLVEQVIDGVPTGKLVPRYDYQKFKEAQGEMYQSLADKFEKNSTAYHKEIARWYKQNTEVIPNVKEYIEKKKLYLTKDEYEAWYKKNTFTRDVNGKKVLVYKGELVRPNLEKYVDAQFKKLSSNKTALDFYEYFTNKLQYLVEHHRDTIISRGYLPAIGVKEVSTFKDLVKSLGFTEALKQSESINTTPSGQEIRYLPFKYISLRGEQKPMPELNEESFDWDDYDVDNPAEFQQAIRDANEIAKRNKEVKAETIQAAKDTRKQNLLNHSNSISHDMETVFKLFAKEAIKNKYKSSIESEVKIATELLKNGDFLKTTETGKVLYDKIANAITGVDNPVVVSGETTNVVKHLEFWTKMVFYEDYQAMEGEWTKYAKILQNLTSLNGLGLNYVAGINNYMIGKIGMWTEAAGNQFIGSEGMLKARKAYASNIMSFLADMKKEKSSSLVNAIIRKFDVMVSHEENTLSDGTTVSGNIHKVLMLTHAAYFFNHIGEHAMQNEMLLALMMEHKVVDGKIVRFNNLLEKEYESKNLMLRSGMPKPIYESVLKDREELKKTLKGKWDNAQSLYDSYELVDGYAQLKQGIEIEDTELADFERLVLGINQDLHGIYNREDLNVAQHWMIGRLAFQFRKWMRPGWNRRFGSKFGASGSEAGWDERRGMSNEGMYVSFWNFAIAGGYKEGMAKSTEETTFIEAMKNIAEGYSDYFQNVKLHWHSMDETQKANVKRTFAELGFLTSMILLGLILRNLRGDDDDRKHSRMWNWALYQQDRSVTELATYIPIYGWFNEGKKLFKSPAPGVSSLEHIMKLFFDVMEYPFISDEERRYQSGIHHNELKIKVEAIKSTPLIGQIYRIKQFDQDVKTYKLFTY